MQYKHEFWHGKIVQDKDPYNLGEGKANKAYQGFYFLNLARLSIIFGSSPPMYTDIKTTLQAS